MENDVYLAKLTSKHAVLKELKKSNKENQETKRTEWGLSGLRGWETRVDQAPKLEIIQYGATLVKYLGNPFGSTWIQKLITTKLRQKDLEHHLRCQAQDIELGV